LEQLPGFDFLVGFKNIHLKLKLMVLIEINNPKEVNSKRVKETIKKYISEGIKSKEIFLKWDFICDEPEQLVNQFKILKNKLYFENDFKN
jgi:hypothetical protein